jgi:hypothetical protein
MTELARESLGTIMRSTRVSEGAGMTELAMESLGTIMRSTRVSEGAA